MTTPRTSQLPITSVEFEQTRLDRASLIARVIGGPQAYPVLILVVPEGQRRNLEADVRAIGMYPASEQPELLQRLRLATRYDGRLVPDRNVEPNQGWQLSLL